MHDTNKLVTRSMNGVSEGEREREREREREKERERERERERCIVNTCGKTF